MSARPRSTLKELDDTEEYLESAGFAKRDTAACRKYLQMAVEHAVRRPACVARAAACVLAESNAKKAKLSKRETYQAMELHAYASLDLGDLETCERHVRSLESVFPKSARVGKLLGCMLEAEGAHDDALKLYDDLLAQAPAEQRLMKRRVACLKAAGRVGDAIAALSSYLDVFMGDVAAWEELALLYVSVRKFAQAVFCWEEVIMALPQLGKHHRRMAETYYTWGGYENLKAARKYYAAALDMSTASDVRAMYGLVFVDKKLRDLERTSKGSAAASKLAAGDVAAGDLGSELGKDAAAFLPRLYQAACPGLVPLVEKQMRSAGL